MPDDIEDIYDERDNAIAMVDQLETIVAEQQAKLDAVCEEHGHLPRVRGDWPEDNVCPRCGDLETGLIEHAPEPVEVEWKEEDPAEWGHLNDEDDEDPAEVWTFGAAGGGAVMWMTWDVGYMEGTGEREVWSAAVGQWELTRGLDRDVVQRQAEVLAVALQGELSDPEEPS